MDNNIYELHGSVDGKDWVVLGRQEGDTVSFDHDLIRHYKHIRAVKK